MDGNFIIGPAVDEAASRHELSQGAFVWIAPSAEKFIVDSIAAMRRNPDQQHVRTEAVKLMIANIRTNFGADAAAIAVRDIDKLDAHKLDSLISCISNLGNLPGHLIHAKVPLKGGDAIDCFCLNPLVGGASVEWFFNQTNLAMQSEALDVEIKRRNTLSYLQYCRSHMDMMSEKFNDSYRKVMESVH